MNKIKKLFYTTDDSDFNSSCGDYLTGDNAKLFIDGKYTHVIADDLIFSVVIINHSDGSKDVLIDEEVDYEQN